MGAPATLWAYEGKWTVDREIEDHLGGPRGRFLGFGVFSRSGQRLAYNEVGKLKLGEAEPMHATRRYFWRKEQDWIQIDFADGKPFHAFPLGVDEPEATHLCDPDRYEVAYDFRDWPNWTAHWRVTGPRKDYTMVSRFGRAT